MSLKNKYRIIKRHPESLIIKEPEPFNVQILVQVKKWYGWVTIKKYPVYNLLNPKDDFNKVSLNHGDYLPGGNRNISYYELCAEELLEKLETND